MPEAGKKPKRISPALYLMLAPYGLGLVALVGLPALLSIGLALTHYDALSRPSWAGLGNLATLLDDRLFWTALGNTLFYLGVAVPLRVMGALGLALLLRRRVSGTNIARTAVYLPTVIPDVAYALVWLVALNPRFGPLNLALNGLGLPAPAWLVEPWPARWALAMMAIWQLGEGFVILLASLNDIPAHLYEAAALDGAGAWARVWHITLPLLRPRLLLLTARDTAVCLQANLTPSLVLTRGGPGYATLFLPLYAYWLAFDDLRFGYATSLLWATYAIVGVAIVLVYAASKPRQAGDG